MKRSINKLTSLLIIGTLVLPLGLFVSGAGMSKNVVKLSGESNVDRGQDLHLHNSHLLPDSLGEKHVYPGGSIQGAIDVASPGDTIYVHDNNGNPYTYHENVDMNKWLCLIGDSRDTVTIQAVDTGDHTVHITAGESTMTGFTVTGSYECGYGGVCLEYVDGCTISDNNCRENLCAGIFLKHCNNCEITNNNVSDNDCGGIKLASNSGNNVVKGNIITSNTNMGMNVYGSSSDNLIYNNYFDNPSKNAIDGVPWANTWNIPKESGTNIIGGPNLGGNYWSDYTGVDDDSDGLGDTSYEIKNSAGTEVTNMDYLPLVPWTPQPILSYSPHSHNFGNMGEGETDSTTFEIWNSGTGTLTYSLSESCSWINVNPTSGSSTGEHNTITVNIDTTGLDPDDYSYPISIPSNGGSGSFTVTVTIAENNPPDKPTIDGPTSGKVKTEHEYTFISTDPDEDNVSYYIDWGDEQVEEWIGPYRSGEEVTVNHTWDKKGTYTIKAKVKDVYDAESDWTTLEVSMPRNKLLNNPLFLQFLERLMDRFPLLERISFHFTNLPE